MNNPHVDTNQPVSEAIVEQMQGCPQSGFWLIPDIVTEETVSGATGRSAAKSGTAKGGGRKIVSNGTRPASLNRKRKTPKSRRKRISAKQL